MTTYAEFHRRSIEDRDGFWGEQAQLIGGNGAFLNPRQKMLKQGRRKAVPANLRHGRRRKIRA